MGTIFEPFIIAFWVFIFSLIGFFLWAIISIIIRSHKKDNDK